MAPPTLPFALFTHAHTHTPLPHWSSVAAGVILVEPEDLGGN